MHLFFNVIELNVSWNLGKKRKIFCQVLLFLEYSLEEEEEKSYS